MPAHADKFPWMSYYGHYDFFEKTMRSHGKVANLHSIGDGLHEMTLVDGRVLKVFICECYSYSVAEYLESVNNMGELHAIVINSNWCGYTMEAKIYCRNNKVGLYDINGFMAALNRRNYWTYLTSQEKDYLEKKG